MCVKNHLFNVHIRVHFRPLQHKRVDFWCSGLRWMEWLSVILVPLDRADLSAYLPQLNAD